MNLKNDLELPIKFKYKNYKDIILFKNVIKKKDCNFIINAIENKGVWEEATTLGKVEDYRKTKINYLTKNFGNHSDLLKAHSILSYAFKVSLEEMMKIYKYYQNNELVSHVSFNGDEGFQVLKYDVNNFYKEHIDSGYNLTRNISFVIYLNDDFEGGETFFPRHKIKIKPKTGSILIFPSTYTHPHVALEIKKGIKYSAVIWSF